MSSDRWILGLGIGGHDSAAALLRNGVLVAMGEQERFSRVKKAFHEAPAAAAQFCLGRAGIGLGDVTAVALGTDYSIKNVWKGWTAEELRTNPKHDDPERLFPHAVFNGQPRPRMVAIRHHLAHAASTFRVSGFERAAVLIVDNQGEDNSTSLYLGDGNDLTLLETHPVPVSLGLYYRTAAQFTGIIGKLKEVGKFMALASYGNPTQRVPLAFRDGAPVMDLPDLPDVRGAELPALRSKQLFEFFAEHCFPYVAGLREEVMAYADFAASVQRSLEDTLLALCERIRRLTGCDKLALAGGVALNCSANGVIARSGIFDEIFVQPAAHDVGVALGAALELDRRMRPDGERVPFVMEHAYWGPEFGQDAIAAALDRHGLSYRVLDEGTLPRAVAEILAQEKVVGWYQGRAEIGPRALGARSLLGDPRSRRTLIRMNAIKGREMWRPLAPSVLAERFDEYFDGPHASPFMIVAAHVRPEKHRDVPAIVHVDGSARPQNVTRAANPRYWELIRAFEEVAGVPIVVNTSFNVAGEPIVNTPDDAVVDFLNTDMDALAIGDALVVKT